MNKQHHLAQIRFCLSDHPIRETFGALGGGKYRIEFELRLDHGQYLVDTRIPFDSVTYSNS